MKDKLLSLAFGDQGPSRLPERVRQSISAHQFQSEILIGWVQLVLVGFFGALYAIAPKTSEVTIHAPVPWALGLYLIFTVVRLACGYKRFLPSWLLLLSVAADMGLLLVLIWSFHIQYDQPAPFYLKAPTLLYAFIFISLRTLRFEPRYVVAAGVTAAAGWLVLLGYALYSSQNVILGQSESVITRDYVLYMTSNRVLIGAEIDKIISILLVTLVLAIALVRGQRLLVRSIQSGTEAQDLSRFVSPEIANRITTADEAIRAGDGEVKEATVMFTDIEGFSAISERLSPQDLIRCLNDYFTALDAVIRHHGGVITQFEGDALLVTFNTVHPDPDHAANAVRTALAIQAVIRERQFGAGVRWKTRCGINTGTMVAGAFGSDERLLFTVHGDEVNIASRLEQLNKEYGTYIMVSESTARICGTDFPFERKGTVTMRGRATTTTVYALAVDAVPPPPSPPLLPSSPDTAEAAS